MNVAVIGGSECSKIAYNLAEKLGRLIASQGWVLVCGGLGGAMEAACRGAKSAGGLTVGILPGFDAKSANIYVDVKIPTGLDYARNILVIRSADVVVAVEGKYGTLSEIAFALNEKKKVIGINAWRIKKVINVNSPEEAVKAVKRRIFRANAGLAARETSACR